MGIVDLELELCLGWFLELLERFLEFLEFLELLESTLPLAGRERLLLPLLKELFLEVFLGFLPLFELWKLFLEFGLDLSSIGSPFAPSV